MDKWLNNPMVVRIVALFLAVMLWFVVNYESPTENPPRTTAVASNEIHIDNVELELRYDEARVSVVEAPETVDIVLRGNPRDLSRFRYDNYTVYADLTQFGPGEVRVPVQFEGFPESLEVSAAPSEVTIVLEGKERKQMGIDLELLGRVPEGYELGEPVVRPNKVHVIGAKSQLDNVVSVKAYLNVSGRTEAVRENITLRALDTEGNTLPVSIDPAVVQVELPVTSPHKTVPLQINWLNETLPGYSVGSVEISASKVELYGASDVLQQYDYYEGPDVDLSPLRESQVLTLPIHLEPGLIKVEPAEVEVRVEVVPSEEQTFEELPVKVNGLRDGTALNMQEPEELKVDIAVEGAPERLSELSAGDIEVFLDVSNLSPGEYTKPLALTLPPFIKVKGEAPEVRFSIVQEGAQEEGGTQEEAAPEEGVKGGGQMDETLPEGADLNR